ncbi:MAG: hypothetical protein LBD28_03510, partial [Tannerellaceae bacterium]|nr:hypothetical protein [Tannerellaceae bacterium]
YFTANLRQAIVVLHCLAASLRQAIVVQHFFPANLRQGFVVRQNITAAPKVSFHRNFHPAGGS